MGYTLEQLQKMGAKPVSQSSGALKKTYTAQELSKMGARPVSGGFPKSEPLSVTQDFITRLQSTGKTGDGPIPQKPMTYTDRLLNMDGPAYNLSEEKLGIKSLPKVATNIANSALKFGKGTVDFLNPLHTGETLKKIAGGGNLPGLVRDFREANASTAEATRREKALGKKSPLPPKVLMPGGLTSELGSAAYQTVVPPAVQQAVKGEGTKAVQSLAEDPFQLAPALLAAQGGLKGTKAGEVLDTTVKNIAKPVTVPAELAGKAVSATAKFGSSQLTGLSPETIKTIRENPKSFSPREISSSDRSAVVDTVHKAIEQRINDLSETGKGYEVIRKSGAVAKTNPSWVVDSLKKNGWADQTGAIKETKLANISGSEQAALKKFQDVWGSKQKLTAEEFLDGRKYLDTWSKWQSEVQATDSGKALFRQLRNDFNESVGRQYKGLAELDAKYGPEMVELRKIQDDYLNPDGSLKDNASSKIANLSNKGREQVLARLEKIAPDIGRQVRVLKAIEDINAATGQKVGTYARAGALGGAGVATMNPALIAAAIVANPAIATQIIRFFGATSKAASSVIERATNSVKESLNSEPNMGLSIKDKSGYEWLKPKSTKRYVIRYKNPKTGKIIQLKNLDRDTARGWHQYLSEQGMLVN